ncbi:hypothetical protein DAPPUDRAFT_316293 [Daphnia pulex]|uniref:BTB domain-containing protein n=1 Tax=Daphnia pulex TaxID=6669 RepID=E9GCG0_DAPPU|nr:hypothetical protein DAPPUDRAFT_316293 [Daphnia pulex]|eukprot:EFX82550.1 hypothetical protein DAPPUDRAFT_316293 [Daphnia pulex]
MASMAEMIVEYEWILENVGEEPMTIASKMISFRGEKVFRVGLKNHALNPVLFLVVIDLHKIGMMVLDVTYGIQSDGTGPAKMKKMMNENISDTDVYLDLFKTVLDKKIVGNCTFAFRIVISGNDPNKYIYLLSDRLAKDQLWAALKNQQNLADVEFIVKDKTFPAHKAILAARSPVFADKFERLQPDVPQQIRIDNMEPSTVEKFLHFIYTGETMGTLADEELLELSDKYGRHDDFDFTLAAMCVVGLNETRATDLTLLMECLNDGVGVLSSSLIM